MTRLIWLEEQLEEMQQEKMKIMWKLEWIKSAIKDTQRALDIEKKK